VLIGEVNGPDSGTGADIETASRTVERGEVKLVGVGDAQKVVLQVEAVGFALIVGEDVFPVFVCCVGGTRSSVIVFLLRSGEVVTHHGKSSHAPSDNCRCSRLTKSSRLPRRCPAPSLNRPPTRPQAPSEHRESWMWL
jgi:hypothetical protein